MNAKLMIEIFGYIGSVMVVVSMLMSNIVKLRIINTVGSVISGVYAVICGAVPLALMNTCLILINAVSLYRLLKSAKSYDLIDADANDSLVQYFLERYAGDIRQYFPDFEQTLMKGKRAWIVCCEGAFAGILAGEEKNGVIEICIDYTTLEYRDCSVGRYLYEKLASMNVKKIVFSGNETEEHVAYMKKMGFVRENGIYVNNL